MRIKSDDFKKFLCLVLCSVLLISNTQVFARDVPEILSPKVRSDLDKRVKKLKTLLDQLEGSVIIEKEAIKVHDFERYTSTITDMSKDIETFEREYRSLLGDINYYKGQINGVPTNPLKKQSVTETLAKRYYGSGAIIDPVGITIADGEEYIPGVLDFKATIRKKSHYGGGNTGINAYYSADVEKRLQAINRLREDVTYTELFSIQSDLYGEANGVFKKLEQMYSRIPTEQIWERAFSHLTPEQQASVNLVLQASKRSKSAVNLAKDINRYLARFKGAVKPSLWNTLKLSRELSHLTPEARIKYVDEITKLKPNEMHLARSVAERPAVANKFLKIGTPLMIVGVVLTAVSITEVNAQNAFPKFASITEKDKIKKAIENDEEVSAVSAIRWYTDPANASAIEKNNAHYMNQIALLFSVAQAQEDEEGILAVMRELDPDPGVETAQIQEQVEQEFATALEQYI